MEPGAGGDRRRASAGKRDTFGRETWVAGGSVIILSRKLMHTDSRCAED